MKIAENGLDHEKKFKQKKKKTGNGELDILEGDSSRIEDLQSSQLYPVNQTKKGRNEKKFNSRKKGA